ncbi:MAG: WecB/TagA/CpsF family glycosyltransferase [Rubripirellula sp.]
MSELTIPEIESVRVFGVPVSVLESNQHAIEVIQSRAYVGEQTFVVAINPEKISAANNDPDVSAVLESADLHICDGVGAAFAVLALQKRRIPRITGISLFFDLIGWAAKTKTRLFLLGASAEVNKLAAEKLCETNPDLIISGRQDGYFESDDAVVKAINNSGAELLFVAMGSPKQEYWMAKHRADLKPRLLMGIGGSLDVASGRVTWAPSFFRRTGTEFFYRLCCQPSRWRRQAKLPLFAAKVLLRSVLPKNSN